MRIANFLHIRLEKLFQRNEEASIAFSFIFFKVIANFVL
jgi:hypothetical protein